MAPRNSDADAPMESEQAQPLSRRFVDIKTAEELHSVILDSKREKNITVLELFSSWCGPCKPMRNFLNTLATSMMDSTVDIPLTFFGLDTDAVIAGLPAIDEDGGENAWRRILLPFASHVEPIFIFVRSGILCGLVEGPNTPLIEHMLRTTVHTDVRHVVIPMTQREAERAVFTIQTAWRRNRQLKRLGVFINGVFYTHAEIALQAAAEAARQEAAHRVQMRREAATRIQAWMRGVFGRIWMAANRRVMEQKFRMVLLRKRASRTGAQRKEYLYTAQTLPPLLAQKFAVLARRAECRSSMTPFTPTETEEKLLRKKLKM
eukprot:PhM_4_TR17915/c0_g1_i1/m.10882